MARLGKKNILSGMIGNLVFRNLDGKQIVQSRPEEVRQSTATKISSTEFRQCSRWAKQLRIGLYSFLVHQNDSYMYRRLTGRVYQALLSNTALLKGQRTPLNAKMDDLVGFEFNIHSPFASYFLPKIAVTFDSQRQINVVIPDFEPKTQMLFPDRTIQAELLVYVYATTLEFNAPIVDAFFTLLIERYTPILAETVWTSPILPEGHFVLVTAKVMYFSQNRFMVKNYSNSKALSPAMVLFSSALPH